jgi:hypothetical protein
MTIVTIDSIRELNRDMDDLVKQFNDAVSNGASEEDKEKISSRFESIDRRVRHLAASIGYVDLKSDTRQ